MARIPGRRLVALGLSLAASIAIAGCASDAAPTWTFPTAAAPVAAAPVADAPAALPAAARIATMPAAPAAAPTGDAASRPTGGSAGSPASAPNAAPAQGSGQASGVITRLDLTIVTGNMTGHTEYPAYIPSDFTLPAYSTVVVTITNFDDATPLAPALASYANVSGTAGDSMQVTPIDPRNPNGSAGPTRELTKLDPGAVSHTFTIPSLGINVPITAHARTTFVITTGAPGTFAWRCFDPCGAGSIGWGTAMGARSGYMEGTLAVS